MRLVFSYGCILHAERLVKVLGVSSSFLLFVFSVVLVPHQDFVVEAVVMLCSLPTQAFSDANVTCPLATALTVGIRVELFLFGGFPVADMAGAEQVVRRRCRSFGGHLGGGW